MKKRLLLILMAFALPLAIFAGKVTQEKALQIAQKFLKEKGMPELGEQRMYGTGDSDARGYYVFNAEKGGFVIVAGDDRVPTAVLGYSEEGKFNYSELPPHVKAWMDGYTAEIKALESMPEVSISKKTIMYASSVSPLLKKIEWDQFWPYFNECPMIGDEHTVTGCVATAMAQIMRYHEWPEKGKGSVTYTWNGQELSADFSQSTYNWKSMTSQYNSKSKLAAQNAVALLMRDCGYSVRMDYGLGCETCEGSFALTSDAKDAFIDYFSYDPNTIEVVYRSDKTDEEWTLLLKNEIDNKRPILYRGRGTGGHAFVCDGYNKDGFFHFNFGWSGWCNNYFAFTNINPDEYHFNNDQYIVRGIKPPTAVKKVKLNKTSLKLEKNTKEQLTITITPDNATYKDVTWESSEPTIASVNKNGVVKGLSGGKATITCTSVSNPKVKATCKVTVNAPIEVTSITLNKTELNLETGAKKQKLTAKIQPTKATNKNVIWSTNKPKVATVDAKGNVEVVGVGKAVITCKSESNPKIYQTCTVNVKFKVIKVTGISLNKTSLKLKEGESYQLTHTVKPSNASYQTVEWSSDKENIATVDNNGNVTAHSVGTATITCKSQYYPNIKKTCKVTVTKGTSTNGELLYSYNLNNTTYSLYRKQDKTDIVQDNDGTKYYRTLLTLEVKKSGRTATYTVDNGPYTGINDSQIPCMAINMKTNQMFIFVNSSNGYAYSLNGYCYVTSLNNISFIKEEAFTKANWGWWPYFKFENGQLVVNHFSFAGYYGMKTSRTGYGRWSTEWGNYIQPNDFRTQSNKMPKVYVFSADYNALSNEASKSTTRGANGVGTETTDLRNIQSSDMSFDVYDLSGNKVRQNVKNLDGLPRGLYIINGKKVFKRE